MSLNGKVVLVTGAQEGIGRSIAIAFAKDGANVGVNWLDKECKALEVENTIKSLGANATLVKGDVSKVEDVSSIVTKVIQVFGSIDFLVNNAGVFPRVPFLEARFHSEALARAGPDRGMSTRPPSPQPQTYTSPKSVMTPVCAAPQLTFVIHRVIHGFVSSQSSENIWIIQPTTRFYHFQY